MSLIPHSPIPTPGTLSHVDWVCACLFARLGARFQPANLEQFAHLLPPDLERFKAREWDNLTETERVALDLFIEHCKG